MEQTDDVVTVFLLQENRSGEAGQKRAPTIMRSRYFYTGRNEKELVFFYSINQMSENRYELENCWVAPQYIGQGFGKILFKHLKSTLKPFRCSTLSIVSDPNAEGFYRRMGAIRIG